MSPANLRSSKAAAPERYVSEDYYIRYADILGKFDSLIKDASYTGINLLQGDNLNIKFNSEGSSLFDIKEVRADYKNLGINDTKWTTVSSANDALEELQVQFTV
jgi:flagellin-like hook-associated protein FlgL